MLKYDVKIKIKQTNKINKKDNERIMRFLLRIKIVNLFNIINTLFSNVSFQFESSSMLQTILSHIPFKNW